MERPLLVSIVVGVALLGSPALLEACSCGPNYPPSVLDQYNDVDAAFTGVVINVSSHQIFPGFYDVEFGVTGVWKGVTTSLVHVLTPKTGGACGIPFYLFVAEEWVIYADADWIYESGPLVTHSCTRTRPVEFAEEDFGVLGNPVPVPVAGPSWGAIKEMYE